MKTGKYNQGRRYPQLFIYFKKRKQLYYNFEEVSRHIGNMIHPTQQTEYSNPWPTTWSKVTKEYRKLCEVLITNRALNGFFFSLLFHLKRYCKSTEGTKIGYENEQRYHKISTKDVFSRIRKATTMWYGSVI